MKFSIISLNIGKLGVLKSGNRQVSSGYSKKAVDAAFLTKTGFTGDEQADLKNHGGLDKAVCVYSRHNFHHLKIYSIEACQFLHLEKTSQSMKQMRVLFLSEMLFSVEKL